jgi:hypothetical protein
MHSISGTRSEVRPSECQDGYDYDICGFNGNVGKVAGTYNYAYEGDQSTATVKYGLLSSTSQHV